MDQVMMTWTNLEQFQGKTTSWRSSSGPAGLLLKLVAVCRYSESVVSSEIWAQVEKKDLEENLALFLNEKVALEKANQELSFEVNELNGQHKSKDH